MSDDQRGSYSIPELATRHGVSTKTIWTRIDKGEIRTFRIGRLVRISREAEADYIAATEGKHVKRSNR